MTICSVYNHSHFTSLVDLPRWGLATAEDHTHNRPTFTTTKYSELILRRRFVVLILRRHQFIIVNVHCTFMLCFSGTNSSTSESLSTHSWRTANPSGPPRRLVCRNDPIYRHSHGLVPHNYRFLKCIDRDEILTAPPHWTGALHTGGYTKFAIFDRYIFTVRKQ